MKRKLTWVFLVIALVLLAACGCSTGKTNSSEEANENVNVKNFNDKKIKIKFAGTVPETHDLHIYGVQVFMDKVEELSNGQVEFEYFPNNQIGGPSERLTLLNTGAVDMADPNPSFVSKMPMGNVFQLPGALPDAEIGSKVIWDIIRDETSIVRKVDFTDNKIIPLFGGTLPLYEFITTENNQMKSLDDLKGLKLRSSGGAQDLTLKLVGAVPVTVETEEVYQALDHGTIDGGIFNLPSLEANKTIEVMKNVTTNASVVGILTAYSISEQTWKSFSTEIRDIFVEAGEIASASIAENMQEANERALQNALDKGYNAWTLSEVEKQELEEMLSPAWDEWIEEMISLGLDGETAIVEMNEALKKYQ